MRTLPVESTSNRNIIVTYEINYGDLQIGSKIGDGAFGDVYEATHLFTKVAVKKFHNTDSELFKAECEICEKARHPNIVLCLGFTKNPESIVMEYLKRGSLFKVISYESEGVNTFEIRLKWCIDIIKGLSFLHNMKIVHRDLKSTNVLISEANVAKIADFGTSKRLISNKKKLPTLNIGTAAYMAPEVSEGKTSYQSDIYSLAILFWEIFEYNNQPYSEYEFGNEPIAVMYQVKINLVRPTFKKHKKI